MSLSPKILADVQGQFSPKNQSAVIELLATYGQRDLEREVEAVQWAILQLANGDLDRLRRLVDLAKGDYRDVLAWASQRKRHKPTR